MAVAGSYLLLRIVTGYPVAGWHQLSITALDIMGHMTPLFRLATVLAPVVFVAFLGVGGLAWAALPCGTQPEAVPDDAAAQIRSDSDLIIKAPVNAALRKLVIDRRRQLRQKYADVEPTTLDQSLLWVTCEGISEDRSIPPTEQFDLYSNIYRLLSEPIVKPEHAAE